MAINHPIFVIKKYTGTASKINARNLTSFAPSACSPVFEYPIIDEVEYVPVAFVCNERSNASCTLNGVNLDPEGTKLFGVGNVSASDITSSTTHSITVMFAPSYMVDGDGANPIFKKRSFYLETGDSLSAGTTHSYTANDFEYVIPEGYVPFSLTKFFVEATNAMIFTTINPFATGDETFVGINNMYTAARSTNETTIEVVFVREDMQDMALRQALNITVQSGISVTCNRGSLVLPNEIVDLSINNPDRSNYDYHITIDGVLDEETIYVDDIKYSFSMPYNNASVNVSKAPYDPFFDLCGYYANNPESIAANSQYVITFEDSEYNIGPENAIAAIQGYQIESIGGIICTAFTPHNSEAIAAPFYIRNYTSSAKTFEDYSATFFDLAFIDKRLIDDQRT